MVSALRGPAALVVMVELVFIVSEKMPFSFEPDENKVGGVQLLYLQKKFMG